MCPNGHLLNVEPERDILKLNQALSKIMKNCNISQQDARCAGCHETMISDSNVGFHYC